MATVQTNLSRFRKVKDAGLLVEVAMDDVRLLSITNSPIFLGSSRFNGCTGLAFIGKNVAILGHVAPLMPRDLQALEQAPVGETESIDHFNKILDRMIVSYEQHKASFPPGSSVWGIFGTMLGETEDGVTRQINVMTERVDRLYARLRPFGLTVSTVYSSFYATVNPFHDTESAKGTVVVSLLANKTSLHVEDQHKYSVEWPDGKPEINLTKDEKFEIGVQALMANNSMLLRRDAERSVRARIAVEALVRQGHSRESATAMVRVRLQNMERTRILVAQGHSREQAAAIVQANATRGT